MEQVTEQKESYKDWLNRLATTNTSTEKDSRLMESLLRNHLGCPNARVVIGIVYLEGYGPATSIHSMAQLFLGKAEQEVK